MAEPCLFCDPSQSRILIQSPGWYVRYDNFPATEGHVEVVSKRHVESWFDLRAAERHEGMALLDTAAAKLIFNGLRPDSWNIGINDGPAAGQSIPHLHIHLVPRYAGDQPDPRGGIRRGLPGFQQLADAWAARPALDGRSGA